MRRLLHAFLFNIIIFLLNIYIRRERECHSRQSVLFIICHVQSGENGIFLTHKLFSQMEISGGKVEFQYLRRKLLASSAHLIEAVCVLGQIRYISSVFLCPFGLSPSLFPQAIFLDKSRAAPVHGGAAPWQQDLSHLLTGCKKQHSGCEVI